MGIRGFVAALAKLTPARAEEPTFSEKEINEIVKASLLNGPDGIKYRDIRVGEGMLPQKGDVITVVYKIDVPANDIELAGPPLFNVSVGTGQVIPGWDMAVLGADNMPTMKVGGIRTALIPPQLAYGTNGVGCIENAEDGQRGFGATAQNANADCVIP